MSKAEAIKLNDDIVKMYEALKIKSEHDYLFFKLVIHSGLKVSELLTITVSQVKRLIEKCTLSEMCKAHLYSLIKIRLSETLSEEPLQYIEDRNLSNEDVLFQSPRTNQVLSRQQAYRIIHQASTEVGMGNVGLTTLRKTLAYHAYQKGIPVLVIQKYLGHQPAIETPNFIGLEDEREHSIYISLQL